MEIITVRRVGNKSAHMLCPQEQQAVAGPQPKEEKAKLD